MATLPQHSAHILLPQTHPDKVVKFYGIIGDVVYMTHKESLSPLKKPKFTEEHIAFAIRPT